MNSLFFKRLREQDGWLRQDDEFSDEEIDRFDVDGKGNPSHDEDTHANKKLSNGTVVIGVGEGVSLGAGAAAAVGAVNSKGNRGGVQQAFVASLMFRREIIPDEEVRENPALRALSAYRAVAFPFGDGSAGGEGGGFPVAVADALVEKPRFVLSGCSVVWCAVVRGSLFCRLIVVLCLPAASSHPWPFPLAYCCTSSTNSGHGDRI